MIITSLKPAVSRTDAIRGLQGPLRQMRRGRLEAIVEWYVPFRVFQVEVTNGGKTAQSVFGIDAITGQLDLYSFDPYPPGGEYIRLESANIPQIGICESRACNLLQERLRRSVYLHGFFKVKRLTLRCRHLTVVHIPYWVGIYRRAGWINVEVIDALRNRFEGSKVREIVVQWLRSD